MRHFFKVFLAFLLTLLCSAAPLHAQGVSGAASAVAAAEQMPAIFDDKLLIDGYSAKLKDASKDTLLAMINDDSLYAYRKAAAVRVFRQEFASFVVQKERVLIERMLLRQLERVDSIYTQIEIMHTLVIMDRYRYFDGMVPVLIQKIDHYDPAVTEIAYRAVDDINNTGTIHAREARIEFNTLRKIFFLARKKLSNANPEEPKLKGKLQLLRWAIKALGTEELKNLPKEVISLM
ncbi:MAG: hypothetical protein HQL19_00860 [Candidatus Omnitrophica bacterium]|nr:hypothetical protein [Candidatus Omnitrophota bacterium]